MAFLSERDSLQGLAAARFQKPDTPQGHIISREVNGNGDLFTASISFTNSGSRPSLYGLSVDVALDLEDGSSLFTANLGTSIKNDGQHVSTRKLTTEELTDLADFAAQAPQSSDLSKIHEAAVRELRKNR